MNFNQNTGFSQPTSNLSRKQQQSNKSLQIQRSNKQNDIQQPFSNQNIIIRKNKNLEQVNFQQLVQRKDVLLDLMRDFSGQSDRLIIQSNKKEQYSKRLMLLQQQIQGLMRQSFHYANLKPGLRTIDYSALLNEKQNQVNQLQRKISYLQSQLRMKQQRQIDLEKQLQQRFRSIKIKNDEIEKLKGVQKSYDNNKYPNQVVNNMIKKLIASMENMLKKSNTIPESLQTQVQNWILGLPTQSRLKKKLRSADQNLLQDKYKRYISYLTTEAASIINNFNKLYNSQIINLKSNGAAVDFDPRIIQLIGKQAVPSQFFPSQQDIAKNQILSHFNNRPLFLSLSPDRKKYFNNVSRVSVQVPVQDVRTKALIKKLANQMKRLYTKYPKLASQISPQLSEYLSSQILDVIDVDELDRLVQIVKYKPDIVKVQNVYTLNNQKNRRVQFHLRVLIKALLDEMQKMRLKTGVQPQIDEGVIGMIRQQIMDIVDVQDVLRVYKTVPKIVEVQKVVEQVVEKLVPVPHMVTVSNTKTDIIPIKTVQIVKDTVNVPLKVNRPQSLVRQKLILGNQYNEKVVVMSAIQQNPYETVIQVPKLRQVDKIINLPQEVVHTIQVQGPERIVPMQKTVIQNLVKQKIVQVVKEVTNIVQVQKIVEKVVPVIQQVPKIVPVQKIVQKLVPQIQYLQSQRIENYVVQKPVQVLCVVQKIVPIQKIVEKIVTQPVIVEKKIPVVQRQQIIKQIEIIKQVPIYQKQLIIQDRVIQKPTPTLIQQSIRQVDRIVQVPLIHQKVRVQTQYRKQPVIERQQRLIRQAVYIEVPVVLTEQKVMEIQKPKIHLVKQQYPKQIIKQRIIPVETIRQQLVRTPYIVQKIIQKIVQVPKIVQIEKIVQKIVTVPRVVQKIVQVEKIVQRIVQKNIYHTNIQPVQYLTQVPIEVQKVITIEVPQYIYQTKEIARMIEKPVPVVSQVFRQAVRIQQIQQPPRVTIQRRQVPIQLITQKIVPMVVQDHIFFDLKQQIIVPIQITVPKTLVEQKLIPVQHVIPLLQPVTQIKQKIVQVKVQQPGQLIVQDRIIEKLFVQNQVKVVQNKIPYYNQTIKQVQVMVQKIVQVEHVVKQIQQVPVFIDKIIQQVSEIPKIVEVQKIIQVPVKQQQIITIDRIVPKIVTLNKAFAQIVDKLHQFPRLAQQMKQVQKRLDKIVAQKHVSTEIQQAQVLVQKAVLQQKLVQVDKYINVINQSLNVVDRVIQKPMDPIIIYEQKILEVPVIVQKIAERIVVMPQVVQILKYVHEITDAGNLGVAVNGDIGSQQVEYQRLGKNVNRQLVSLRNLLLSLKVLPDYKNHVNSIDKFLAEFSKFLAYPRIREVMSEKIVQNVVEKDRIVKVPTRTAEDDQRNLASAVLIDKLLNQLKRLKQTNPSLQTNLDPDILNIFGNQLDPISSKYGNNYNQLLDQYTRAIFNKFNSVGTFTQGHQAMLKQFIEQRFQLANRLKKLSKDSTKYKQLYNGVKQNYQRQRLHNQKIRSKFGEISNELRGIIIAILDIGRRKAMEQKLNIIHELLNGYYPASQTPVVRADQLDQRRVGSLVREKDAQILQLRKIIDKLKKDYQIQNNCQYHTKTIIDSQVTLSKLQSKIQQLYQYIRMLQNRGNTNSNSNINNDVKQQITRLTLKIKQLNQYIATLKNQQTDHSKCQNQINQLNLIIIQLRNQISILQSQKDKNSNNTGDHIRYQAEINRITSQVNKYKEEIGKLREQMTKHKTQIVRLREIQIIHGKCEDIINDLEKKLKQRERESTQVGDYGRNYREYVDLNASKHSSDHSVNSQSSRGVYRSAGNYATNNYGGLNRAQKSSSIGTINYLGNQLRNNNDNLIEGINDYRNGGSQSRISGINENSRSIYNNNNMNNNRITNVSITDSRNSGVHTDLNSNQIYGQSPRNMRVQKKELVFNKKGSRLSGGQISSGSSSGLYASRDGEKRSNIEVYKQTKQ